MIGYAKGLTEKTKHIMAEQTPSDGTKPCYKCGHVNRPGVIFCENCGAQVGTGAHGATLTSTRSIRPGTLDDVKDELMETLNMQQASRNFRPGTSVFEQNMVLRMQIHGAIEPLLLRPFEGKAIVFGRNDPDDRFRPDVDLIPFDGYKLGISRRHAALTLTGRRLDVRDLGSSNGTHLNDVQLDENEPHQIRDGDQLRFGNMTFTISFQFN